MLVSNSRAYLRAFFAGPRDCRLAMSSFEFRRVSPRLFEHAASVRPSASRSSIRRSIPRRANRSIRVYADADPRPVSVEALRISKTVGSHGSNSVGEDREDRDGREDREDREDREETDPAILMIRSLSGDIGPVIEDIAGEWSIVSAELLDIVDESGLSGLTVLSALTAFDQSCLSGLSALTAFDRSCLLGLSGLLGPLDSPDPPDSPDL